MKNNLLLLLILVFSVALQAQVSVEPATITLPVHEDDDEVVAHSEVSNPLPQIKTYRWVRNVVESPAEWTSAICDKNQCYLQTTDSVEFDMGPGETGARMDVHLYPNGTFEGKATIEVLIKDVNTPSNNITGIYIFDSAFTGTGEVQVARFKVYPNPTSGLFTITASGEKIAYIAIHDLTGKQVLHLSSAEGQWHDLSSLPAGSYLMCPMNTDRQPLGGRMISKL